MFSNHRSKTVFQTAASSSREKCRKIFKSRRLQIRIVVSQASWYFHQEGDSCNHLWLIHVQFWQRKNWKHISFGDTSSHCIHYTLYIIPLHWDHVISCIHYTSFHWDYDVKLYVVHFSYVIPLFSTIRFNSAQVLWMLKREWMKQWECFENFSSLDGIL